ncbi:MAG: hypothetical protein PHO32_09320 [Candidatus Cloacimonetes bacterium]|nr:hypothetical protein [Candidatus Cloacimonadota bacterium]
MKKLKAYPIFYEGGNMKKMQVLLTTILVMVSLIYFMGQRTDFWASVG